MSRLEWVDFLRQRDEARAILRVLLSAGWGAPGRKRKWGWIW